MVQRVTLSARNIEDIWYCNIQIRYWSDSSLVVVPEICSGVREWKMLATLYSGVNGTSKTIRNPSCLRILKVSYASFENTANKLVQCQNQLPKSIFHIEVVMDENNWVVSPVRVYTRFTHSRAWLSRRICDLTFSLLWDCVPVLKIIAWISLTGSQRLIKYRELRTSPFGPWWNIEDCNSHFCITKTKQSANF